MRVREAKVNWVETFANAPRIEVLMDEVPDTVNVPCEAYEESDEGAMYVGVLDDGAAYLAHNVGNPRGFGGRTFNVSTLKGGTIALKGPWSSSASHAMQVSGRVMMEASATEKRRAYLVGYTFCSAALSWSGIVSACAFAGVVLYAVRARSSQNDSPLPSFWKSLGYEGEIEQYTPDEDDVMDYLREHKDAVLEIGTPFGLKPSSLVKHGTETPLLIPGYTHGLKCALRDRNEIEPPLLRAELEELSRGLIDDWGRSVSERARYAKTLCELSDTLAKAYRLLRDDDLDELEKLLEDYREDEDDGE